MRLVEPLLEVDEKTNQATPSGYARTIDAFLYLITRDRGSPGDSQGRKKRRACKELAYVYYMCDPRSPFFDIREGQKEKVIRERIFSEAEDWKPDEAVEEAMEVYNEAQKTITVKLLESAYKTIHNLRDYLEKVDLDERSESTGKPIHNVKDVTKTLSDIPNVVDGLEKLEERIIRESEKEGQTRGGVEETEFNT